MSFEERIWLNNHLFNFVDENYGTGGTIDFNASLSTEDSRNFSPLRLTISITNGDYNKKICWLSFYQVSELINCINEVMKDSNLDHIYNQNNPIDIERKYSKKLFRLYFKKSKDLNDCVLLGIYSNESDRNVIIMTIDVFRACLDILKQFKENYFLIENMIINRYMTSIELEELKSMNSSLKTMPRIFEDFQDRIENLLNKKIVNNEYNHNNSNIEEDKEVINNNTNDNDDENFENIDDEEYEAEETINEFDKFIGEDFENINLPDMDQIEKEPVKQDNEETINSDFILKLLNNDINNLYSKTKNIIVEDCKIITFNNLFKDELGIDLLENFNEKTIKSAVYFSELNIRHFLKQYYLYGKEYPKTCQMIRTEVNETNPFNKELAYDLLMIHGYIKYYSSKMETRTNDQLASKIDFYINLRLFTDIFTYTYLVNERKDVIKNNIISRFKYFSKNGFFSKFDDELKDYNLEPISVDEISNFVNVVIEKLPNTDEITKVNDQLYDSGNVKLPSDNKFNLEQIINQIVNLEILTNFDLNIEYNAHKFDIDLNKIDKNILLIFQDDKKVNKQKKKQSNLYRYVKYFDNEASDDIKDDFYNHIDELGYENFDFINSKFPLNEIGENIIKGLYQWNISNNKQEKYSDFFYKCNETILNKSDILSKETSTNESSEDGDDDWGNILK